MIGVNSLGPSYAIWQKRPGSTLAQVMACCLTAPSHYLNCDCSSVKSSDIHIMAISQEMPHSLITKIYLKITSKISFKFPRGQWVNPLVNTKEVPGLLLYYLKETWICFGIWYHFMDIERCRLFKSLRPSDAHMRQQTRLSLFQIMAC